MANALLVAVTVLMSVTLIVLVAGVALYIRRLDRAVDEMSRTLRAVREDVLPLAADVRQVLLDVDGLVRSARAEVDSIGRVVDSVESLVEGRTIVDAAGKAVSSSRATVVSVLEGLKAGLKALRNSRKETEEELSDE